MAYALLIVAIALEIVGTTMLKASDGFSKLLPVIISISSYIASLYCLSQVLKHIELGIVYATWCACGTAATFIIAAVFFGERLTLVGVLSVIVIVIGCVVLNLYGVAK